MRKNKSEASSSQKRRSKKPSTKAAQSVTIVEVGLRDGLQNEKNFVSVPMRIEMAKKLAATGVRRIEAGAFVRYDKVPQMQGSDLVIQDLLVLQKSKSEIKQAEFSILVPNEKGMQQAVDLGVKEVAIFASSTESFSQANINCSIEESFQRFLPVIKMAKKHKIKVRGYLSVCFGCPFEGNVDPKKVVQLAAKLIQIGCYEVSIGDTIGVADPIQVRNLFLALKKKIPLKKIAGHFHDTRGTALANIVSAYQTGVRVFDSSLGGLGGCPYAPGSSGNVATEDVLYLFHKMNISTGIDLSKYIQVNHWFSATQKQVLLSKVSKAELSKM